MASPAATSHQCVRYEELQRLRREYGELLRQLRLRLTTGQALNGGGQELKTARRATEDATNLEDGDKRPMILEAVVLQVKSGEAPDCEIVFRQASPIIVVEHFEHASRNDGHGVDSP